MLRPGGYAPEFLRSYLGSGPMSVILSEQPSRGENGLRMVCETAYHSVELSLSLGINSSLFTCPVSLYRPDFFTPEKLEAFRSGRLLGGMMITEPHCGTDITAITTTATPTADGYRLQGVKQWAGLSGLADYWLVLAKEAGEARRLPSLNLYICRAVEGQVTLEERFSTIGLRAIPYGRTRFDATTAVWGPLLAGNSAERFRYIHAILQRSRISIAAITAGVARRLVKLCETQLASRVMFGKSLAAYEQARLRLEEIKGIEIVCGALYAKAIEEVDAVDHGRSEAVDGFWANVVKVVSTDLINSAAHGAAQLFGGNHFHSNGYVGRAYADLRPFRIFEGSNDVLFETIIQYASKAARRAGQTLLEALSADMASVGLPAANMDKLSALLENAHQGWQCLLGRVVANVKTMGLLKSMGIDPGVCQPLVWQVRNDLATLELNPAGAFVSEI